MSGSVELDRDGRSLLIRFPYNPYVVEEVKAIPGRRWDPARKVWRVPVTSIDAACSTGMRHGFAIAPEVTGMLAGTVSVPQAGADAPAAAPGPVEALTISALNQRVRDAITQSFRETLWVVGEILDYDKNKARKHVFFTLVEKQGERTVAARATAVLFERDAERIRQQLSSAAGDLTLADGIEIRARVKVDLYVANGSYQLVVEEIDASFTLGKMALQREAILAELRQQGLDRRNAELPLPVPPLRVGVLCSLDSDGWNDFRKTLEASGRGFLVTAYSVRVQGPELKPTMLAGLRWFADRAAEFDLLCVLRGGGSRTDLAWFDDRDVAFAVARHPLKVLCGIGHERDQSVLDLIAHSEKTPTALAGFLVEKVATAERLLLRCAERLARFARDAVQHARSELTHGALHLRHAVLHRLLDQRHRVAAAVPRLASTAAAASARHHEQLARLLERLTQRSAFRLERESARLGEREARCRLLHPQSVLARGYAIVRRSGRVVKSAGGVQRGDELDVQLAQGRLRVRTESTES